MDQQQHEQHPGHPYDDPGPPTATTPTPSRYVSTCGSEYHLCEICDKRCPQSSPDDAA